MTEDGLKRIVDACEIIRDGLIHTTDVEDARAYDAILGRVLDAARDHRGIDQMAITPYVVWLSSYRRFHAARSMGMPSYGGGMLDG
jgi:hypothetical protein